MGDSTATGAANTNWKKGRLHMIDSIKAGDPSLGKAIGVYAEEINTNRNSRHWVRAVQWVENFLFSLGRHYVDDILISRLSRDSSGTSQSYRKQPTTSPSRSMICWVGTSKRI